jgi:hypothetical protein
MRSDSFLNTLQNSLRNINTWLRRTPERALDEAYEAALLIKALEDAHFGGNPISRNYGNYGESAQSYFQAELKKYLDIIRIRLFEFKASSSILRIPNQRITEIQMTDDTVDPRSINVIDRPAVILKKLRFIDDILARYSSSPEPPPQLVVVSEPTALSPASRSPEPVKASSEVPENGKRKLKSMTEKTGVLPRSIIDTVNRVKQELDPEAEQEIIQSFRSSKTRTRTAIRFLLLLIIVPLLTQQVSKNFIVGPIVDNFRENNPRIEIFLNPEMEERAFQELNRYRERLEFEILVGREPPEAEEQIQEKVRLRAEELQVEYRNMGSDAIKNVFADMIAVTAFVGVLLTSKRQIIAVKAFIDQLVYGLSDSAKAFIIILFTDVFVGFHSPHGWEVILESVSQHFGLPADRNFIFLFIATFPVILDTIFKYWIFRYLNRVSPSAVATYRTMNE